MNEQTIERIAKYMAAFNGDPDAWGAYASQAMDVIELAEDQWESIETAPRDWSDVLVFDPDLRSDWRNVAEAYFHVDEGNYISPAMGEMITPTHWRLLPKPPKN